MMPKFVSKRSYTCSNGEIDDANIWVRADNKVDALSQIQEEYPNSINFVLLRVE